MLTGGKCQVHSKVTSRKYILAMVGYSLINTDFPRLHMHQLYKSFLNWLTLPNTAIYLLSLYEYVLIRSGVRQVMQFVLSLADATQCYSCDNNTICSDTNEAPGYKNIGNTIGALVFWPCVSVTCLKLCTHLCTDDTWSTLSFSQCVTRENGYVDTIGQQTLEKNDCQSS